jgi:U3 small nucleolar RNA-associated protein 7
MSQRGGNSKRPRDQPGRQDALEENVQKYTRGRVDFNTRNVKHKGLRKTLTETKEAILNSASSAAAAEVLLPSEAGFIETEGNERVYKFKQEEIKGNVDMNTARNAFDLQLPNFGPYTTKYSRNGRFMLMGGRKGHIAIMDCLRTNLGAEIQLQEDIHDVQFLHNETMFAAAQQRNVYIYDHNGVEIHCLRDHERPYKLDFLPYHFLLTSVGHSGHVKWHDVSVGKLVANWPSSLGPCRVNRHNPQNAVTHLGHSNGVVSLWSPTAGNKALVSMFCHKSPVNDLAMDREGKYMTTAGMDGFLKVRTTMSNEFEPCFGI